MSSIKIPYLAVIIALATFILSSLYSYDIFSNDISRTTTVSSHRRNLQESPPPENDNDDDDDDDDNDTSSSPETTFSGSENNDNTDTKSTVVSLDKTKDDDTLFTPPKPENIAGREPILQTLARAGAYLDDDTVASLPLWSEVAHLYGTEPVILGTETCDAFRRDNANQKKFVTPSGLFNTGTNYLTELVKRNCDTPLVQNPWWKHSPASMSHAPEHVYNAVYHNAILDHLGVEDKDYTSQILKIMVIKDPFHWIVSMCRKQYSTRWRRSDGNCPNLVTTFNEKGRPEKALLDFWRPMGRKQDRKGSTHIKYHSVVHLWNHWNAGHLASKHAQLAVRYEDLIFHPERVVEEICACSGGTMREDGFVYVVDSAKKQERMTVFNGLVESMVRYGKETNRTQGFTVADMIYCRKRLDLDMMRKFHYTLPHFYGDDNEGNFEVKDLPP